MQEVSTPSLTTVSGHTASSRAAFVTTCPAWRTRAQSTASALGGTGTTWARQKGGPWGPASRYGPKHTPCSACMDPRFSTWPASSEKHQRNVRTSEKRENFVKTSHAYPVTIVASFLGPGKAASEPQGA